MPDCQSGAVHSVGCGTIIGIAVASEHSVFVTPIVTRGKAAKARASRAAAVVGAPVSLGGKETGNRLAQEMAKRISCCRAARESMSCRSGHSGRSGIHHIAVTVRAAGR
jgi:hypothetical protein